MSKRNRTIIWLLIFIFLVTLFASVATYAYFSAREVYEGSFNVELNSKGVDTLKKGLL